MADIKRQISIDATPAKVYAALTTQAGLRNWWTADTNSEERVGGKVELGFDRRKTIFRMSIEKLEPEKLVMWSCHGDIPEWTGTTLIWSISTEDSRTVLRFAHSDSMKSRLEK